MRYIIPISIIYLFCTAQGCEKKQKHGEMGMYKVTIAATFTSPYCGGARPSEEMLEYYRKPRPLPSQVFYIKHGDKNIEELESIKLTETDTAGKVSFELPEGTYSLLLPDQSVALDTSKYRDNSYYRYDRKCLMEWWKKPILVFHVKAGAENIFNIHLSKKCFVNGWSPCEYYIGPKPP